MKPIFKKTLSCLGIALAAALPLASALAGDDGEENRDGDSFRRLSAQWWQWVHSIPPAQNPLLENSTDPVLSPSRCMVGQRGSVWFLAGNFGGTSNRVCTVPENVELFFPVINSNYFNSPGVCGDPATPLSVPELRDAIAPFINAATVVQATLDGWPLHRHAIRRARSVVYATTMPEDNISDAPCIAAKLGQVPGGVYSPSVADGYYAKLDKLSVGRHTLIIDGVSPGSKPEFDFKLHVEYVLDVVPVRTR